MSWEARIIEFLQSAGNTMLDYVVFVLTFLGDELFFVMVASIIYWCFSKRFGFYFINVYLFSSGATNVLKNIIRRPRPYVSYDDVQSIFKRTEGWSFPSGHSSSIAVICTMLTLQAVREKKYAKATIIVSIVLVLTVMFSRIYLGQHYLTDVIAGATFGIVFAMLFGLVFSLLCNRLLRFWMVALPLSLLLLIVFLASGVANSSEHLIQAFGAYGAICVGYALEKKHVNYNVKSNAIWKQLVKILIGLSIAALLMVGGKALLESIIPSGTALEPLFTWYLLYFLSGIWVTLAAPKLFKTLNL